MQFESVILNIKDKVPKIKWQAVKRFKPTFPVEIFYLQPRLGNFHLRT